MLRRRPRRLVLMPLALGVLLPIPALAAAQAADAAALSGAWIIRQESGDNPVRNAVVHFRADSTYAVSQAGEDWIMGTYRIEGHRLTFLDRSGRFACLWDDGAPRVGVYIWTITGERMRLKEITDDCDGRAESLAISWLVRPEGRAK